MCPIVVLQSLFFPLKKVRSETAYPQGFGYPGEQLDHHGALEPLGKQRGSVASPGSREEAHEQVSGLGFTVPPQKNE